MSVSVSIVCHKTPADQLNRALESLLSSEEVDMIYIMDNGPDNSLKIIVDKNPKIIYRHIENKGFGNGHNIAVKEVIAAREKDFISSQEQYHLVMNADVYWEGDIFKPLVEYMNIHTDVGIVMPKVYYPDGDLQYTARMLPTPVDLFFKRFLPVSIGEKRMGRYLLQDHDHNHPLNSPYLLGSFLLFRLKALKESGGFDERFFMYPEDIDITRRIHRTWKTMFWPGVSIIHAHAAASRKNFKMFRIHFYNMVKYFNKWGWIFDKERKVYNSKLREEIKFIPLEKRERGRG